MGMQPDGAALVPSGDPRQAPVDALPRGRGRGLAFAVALSVVFNLLLIILVVGLTRIHRLSVPEEVAVRHIAHVELPPPPAEQPPPEQPQVAPQQVLPPLPPLSVAEPAPTRLALPAPGAADLSLDQLPALMPALVATAVAGPALPAQAPAAIEFDQPPRISAPIAIERFYPLAARNHGITGTSVVSVAVDASGRIGAFSIESSIPPGVFDEALGALVRSLRAEPARAHGVPVSARMRLKIAWTLSP